MRKYSKAYYLKDLRKFDGWKELDRPDAEELNDESIVFVQDNLTVVKDCFEEEDYIYNDVTPEWKQFCEQELQFAIPEDLLYAYEEEEEGEEGAAAEEAPPAEAKAEESSEQPQPG